MDSGQIDFYQHDTVCSNTCRSTKFDVLINSARFPPGTLVQPSLSCLALDHLGKQVPPLKGLIFFSITSVYRKGVDHSLECFINGGGGTTTKHDLEIKKQTHTYSEIHFASSDGLCSTLPFQN